MVIQDLRGRCSFKSPVRLEHIRSHQLRKSSTKTLSLFNIDIHVRTFPLTLACLFCLSLFLDQLPPLLTTILLLGFRGIIFFELILTLFQPNFQTTSCFYIQSTLISLFQQLQHLKLPIHKHHTSFCLLRITVLLPTTQHYFQLSNLQHPHTQLPLLKSNSPPTSLSTIEGKNSDAKSYVPRGTSSFPDTINLAIPSPGQHHR